MDSLAIIGQTIASEFSDFDNIGEVTSLVTRLLLAALLGGILGMEREHQGKAAGVRTHMLVATGAAIFIFIPQQAGISDSEMSRIIQGVITGIGFLCAGTIFKSEENQEVSGLTTAAGIWLTAAIGVSVGLGRELTAVTCTVIAFAILHILPRIIKTAHQPSNTDSEK
ncbi:MAG: MgtC/SapB family protein [Cellvibrio sp.]